jgi:hypothetical protein
MIWNAFANRHRMINNKIKQRRLPLEQPFVTLTGTIVQ